jgi:hypothetical protein
MIIIDVFEAEKPGNIVPLRFRIISSGKTKVENSHP